LNEKQHYEEPAVEFSIKAAAPEKLKSDCIAVPVFASAKLPAAAQALDRASKGRISGILRHGDFEAKPGATLMLYDLAGVASKRVLLVGFGTKGETAAKEYRDGVRGAVRALAEAGFAEAALYIADMTVNDRDARWVTMQAASACLENTYRFDRLKSKSGGNSFSIPLGILGAPDRSQTFFILFVSYSRTAIILPGSKIIVVVLSPTKLLLSAMYFASSAE